MKCTRCESPAEEGKRMCRPHLDEACAQAKKAYADKKRAAQGVKSRRGGAIAVVPVKATVAVTRPVHTPAMTAGDVLSAIDELIAAKQAEVQTLERAKEILARG